MTTENIQKGGAILLVLGLIGQGYVAYNYSPNTSNKVLGLEVETAQKLFTAFVFIGGTTIFIASLKYTKK